MTVKIGVFFGGNSVEHDISIITACQVMAAMDRNKYDVWPVYLDRDGIFRTGYELSTIKAFQGSRIGGTRVSLSGLNSKLVLSKSPTPLFGRGVVAELDAVIPAFHGTEGEDGSFQGLLDILGVPYAGCGVLGSAIGMNKAVFKSVMKSAGLPVLESITVTRDHRADAPFNWPVIVKPVSLGSSIGVQIVNDKKEYDAALDLVFKLCPAALIEPALVNTREVNCSALGIGDRIRTSVCEEPIRNSDMLTFGDKYQAGDKKAGMASASRVIPANISAQTEKRVQELTREVFRAIEGSGVARVDFLLGPNEEYIYVNEINTIPGSFSFYLWEKTGLSFQSLIDELISIAVKKKQENAKLKRSFETGVLFSYSGKAGKLK